VESQRVGRSVLDYVDSGARNLERAASAADRQRLAHETHSLTHHGTRPEMIEELRSVEEQQFSLLGEFLVGLDEVREGQGTLLDQTMVLHGSCMGNANAHSNAHLPVLLAGGGFRHAGHLKCAPHDEQPLTNLYRSML